jgi:phosphate/sulfate permease
MLLLFYYGGSMKVDKKIPNIIAYTILLLLGVAMVFTIYGAWIFSPFLAGIMAMVWVLLFRYMLTLFKD